ncbi:hypothetical protein [Dactylosporangium sp. CA-139066]|uniref:hypothetical protein n=1 Tax=Dactylosporangium sp. CA-139066 TaxID=3239930 RepID=UPI003D92D612
MTVTESGADPRIHGTCHEGSTVVVGLNSRRLLADSAWRHPPVRTRPAEIVSP